MAKQEQTVEELLKQIEEKDKLIQSKNDEIAQSVEITKQLKKEVDLKKDLKAKPNIEIDGVTYEVAVESFTTRKGQKVTAEELVKDEDACQELIDNGSYILRVRA